MPAALSAENESRTLARVVIRQGKYHQVKRMFAALGCEVVSLKRICMGDLPLDEKLIPGECKYLLVRKFQKSRICKNCKNRPPWHKILWFLAAFLFALCNLNKKYDKLYIKCLQIV